MISNRVMRARRAWLPAKWSSNTADFGSSIAGSYHLSLTDGTSTGLGPLGIPTIQSVVACSRLESPEWFLNPDIVTRLTESYKIQFAFSVQAA